MKLKKRTFIRILTFLFAAIVGLGVFAGMEYACIDRFRLTTENTNRQAFYDLSQALQNLDYAMQKAEYASTPYSRVVLTADIQREAGIAQAAMERLPVIELMLGDVTKLFSLVSDYSFTLAKKSVYGQEITDAEKETLRDLRARASELYEALEKMDLTFEDPETEKATIESALSPQDGETSVLKEMNDALIDKIFLTYDGQYSVNLFDGSSEYLSSLEKMTQEQARPVAAVYMDVMADSISCIGKTDAGDLSAYLFTDGKKGVSVSVRGGKLMSYWDETPHTGENDLPIEDVVFTVGEQLKHFGFENVEVVYHKLVNGTVQLSFAPVEDGIWLYPEVITVTASGSTGEIVGIDAAAYLKYHKERRDYPFSPEAQASVAVPYENTSVRQVVLQTDGRNEICCYEHKIHADDGTVLLYINAENGKEEKILLLIENETGSFTR